MQTFKPLGCNWHLTKDLFQQLEKFLCCVFGQRNVSSVNTARFNIFHLTGKFDNNLPPCQNSLWLHAERANYQAAIWRQCLHININALSPTNHGWKREDQELVIHWSSLPTTSSTFINLIKCNCKKNSCDSRRCSCVRQTLPCTDFCQCVHCSNVL